MYEKGANADGRTHKKCRDFVIALGLWFTARARLDRQISKINQFLASDFVRSTRFFFQKREKQRKSKISIFSRMCIAEKILFSMGTEEQTLHTTMSASDFVTRKTKQVQKTLLL